MHPCLVLRLLHLRQVDLLLRQQPRCLGAQLPIIGGALLEHRRVHLQQLILGALDLRVTLRRLVVGLDEQLLRLRQLRFQAVALGLQPMK